MGKSARSFRASSFGFVTTAIRLSYRGATFVPQAGGRAYPEWMRRLWILLVALLVALGAAACGGGGHPHPAANTAGSAAAASNGPTPASAVGAPSPGAKVFADAGCGSCHTLAAAA